MHNYEKLEVSATSFTVKEEVIDIVIPEMYLQNIDRVRILIHMAGRRTPKAITVSPTDLREGLQ